MERGGLLGALRDATRDEYRIDHELGRGGMAAVYLAQDLNLARPVAIKVMLPDMMEHEGSARRFLLEARTAARLDHENIIPIYSVKSASELLFFVMKYVEGNPLDRILKDHGQLPIPVVHRVLTSVAGALGYAHARQVVHRDIKPGNILIDHAGRPIVMDFGIAKVPTRQDLTRAGSAIGTPKYMSPEQCQGADVTGASDQYSLGIVAFQMLTGEVPFKAPSVGGLLLKQIQEPAPDIHEKRPDCPPRLKAAVERMLEKDPKARWSSMAELTSALGTQDHTQIDATRTALQAIGTAEVQPKEKEDTKKTMPTLSSLRAELDEAVIDPTATGTSTAAAGPPTVEAKPPSGAAPATSDGGPQTTEAGSPTTEAAPSSAEADAPPAEPEQHQAPPEPTPTRSGPSTAGVETSTPPAETREAPAVRPERVSPPSPARKDDAAPSPAPEPSRKKWVVPAAAVVSLLAAGTLGWSFLSGLGADDTPLSVLNVTPEEVEMGIADTLALNHVAMDSSGVLVFDAALEWASDNEAVARVSDGVITATGPGTAIITVTSGDVVDSTTVTVGALLAGGDDESTEQAPPQATPGNTAAPSGPAAIRTASSAYRLTVGESQQLQATVSDAAGNALQSAVQWRTEDASIAIVETSAGRQQLTGLVAGQTRLRASSGGVTSEWLTVTVDAAAPEAVARVNIAPGSLSLEEGEAGSLRATVVGQSSPSLDRPVSWQSGNLGVAAVDGNGNVTALSAGQAVITATSGGVSATVNVSVAAAAPTLAVSSISGTFAFDGDNDVLSANLTVGATAPAGSTWCAVVDLQRTNDDGETVTHTAATDFTPGASSNVGVQASFDDLDLASRGNSRAQLAASVQVFASSCAQRGGTPLGSGQVTPICAMRRITSDWAEEPCPSE